MYNNIYSLKMDKWLQVLTFENEREHRSQIRNSTKENQIGDYNLC